MINFKVCGRNSIRKKLIEAIIPSVFSQLKLDRFKFNLLISFEKELEHSGTAVYLDEAKLFVVVLKPSRSIDSLGITFCHEMVHVSQMAKGILRNTEDGYIWKNRKFSNNVDYLDRPWEIQAYQQQEIIFRKSLTN